LIKNNESMLSSNTKKLTIIDPSNGNLHQNKNGIFDKGVPNKNWIEKYFDQIDDENINCVIIN
jgi:hypothetical protein